MDPGAPYTREELRLVRSRSARLVLQGAGVGFVGLGLVGVFLPVLPTTPFLLLAAACFVRSSPALYERLLGHATFGPLIRDWREHRSIPARAKGMALLTVAVTFGTSIAVGVSALWLRLLLAAIGLTLFVYLLRLPTRPAPVSEAHAAREPATT